MPRVQNFIRRLKWPDYVIAAVLIAFFGYIWYSIEGTLNYKWRWELIPGYIVGWHSGREEYFANLLLQGLVATIRISIYASILALILGTILGVARCSANLTIRMLARTYLEFLRNIPPVVVVFIFFFFLSQQLIDALDLARWSRRIARQEDIWLWEFFFGDMRLFPSMISGVIVLALFESAFVGEIVRSGIQSIDRGQRDLDHDPPVCLRPTQALDLGGILGRGRALLRALRDPGLGGLGGDLRLRALVLVRLHFHNGAAACRGFRRPGRGAPPQMVELRASDPTRGGRDAACQA